MNRQCVIVPLLLPMLLLTAASDRQARVQAAPMSIRIDYTLDSNNFFDTAAKRAALTAAVSRFERVLAPTALAAVAPSGWRVGFRHPGTGLGYELSSAVNEASDALVGAGAPTANQYGFAGLVADEWILYAGGRNLTSGAAQGGTGTGTNFTPTLNDLNGPHHRGLIPNTPAMTINDLPVWGGSITFDSIGVNWHFDTTIAAPIGTTDFYSLALHEIGHALGLAVGFNQFTEDQTGTTYDGTASLAAYNADNSTSLSSLALASVTDRHWEDGTYQSNIFAAGSPNLVGTVGLGAGQDLLMEPTANFTASTRRLELTNVDVGQLTDLGWTVTAVPEPGSLLLLAAGTILVTVRRRRLPQARR